MSDSATGVTTAFQYGRDFKLLVSNSQGNAIDLSSLRVKFSVKRSAYLTPNVANIIVYNLDLSFATLIKQQYTRVILQAGYSGNTGVVFKGNIKQFILGRESATDTFLNLICADGDQAYNYAIVTQTIGSASTGGASPEKQLNTAMKSMSGMGVGTSYIGALPQVKLPRGKVMYGNAREYIKSVADTNGFTWSIQDEKIVFIKQTTYLPGTAVVLTAKTGMVGTPQQTILGIQCKCLLNPKIKCHGRVQIDNASVQRYQLDFTQPFTAANTPVPLSNDGVYYVLVAEHSGDTRGTEWYSNLQLLVINPSSNALNSVNAGIG
jgi:hypothetical protein